jgi:hypothetical protein
MQKKSIFRASVVIFFLLVSGCSTPSMIVTQEQQKGDAAANHYEYAVAEQHYQAAFTASQKLGVYRNPDMEASICRKLSYTLSVRGKYDDALKYAN